MTEIDWNKMKTLKYNTRNEAVEERTRLMNIGYSCSAIHEDWFGKDTYVFGCYMSFLPMPNS